MTYCGLQGRPSPPTIRLLSRSGPQAVTLESRHLIGEPAAFDGSLDLPLCEPHLLSGKLSAASRMQRSPALLLWLRTLPHAKGCEHVAQAPYQLRPLTYRAQTTDAHQQSPDAGSQTWREATADSQAESPTPAVASAAFPTSTAAPRPPARRTGADVCWDQILSHGHLPRDEDMSTALQVVRRHNTSLPILEGQVILCRVLSVSRQSLLLDTGRA